MFSHETKEDEPNDSGSHVVWSGRRSELRTEVLKSEIRRIWKMNQCLSECDKSRREQCRTSDSQR